MRSSRRRWYREAKPHRNGRHDSTRKVEGTTGQPQPRPKPADCLCTQFRALPFQAVGYFTTRKIVAKGLRALRWDPRSTPNQGLYIGNLICENQKYLDRFCWKNPSVLVRDNFGDSPMPDFHEASRCSTQTGRWAEAHFSTRLQAQRMFGSVPRVKWTSPRHFTHCFDSLHLGGDANLLGPREMDRKKRTVRYTAKMKWGGSDPTL